MANKTAVIHVRVTPELKEKLEELAIDHHRSSTNMLEYLIEDAWDGMKYMEHKKG